MTDRYEAALERARKLRDGFEGYNANIAIIEEIFPELRESEDERIRKIIVKHFEELHEQSWINLEIPDILAWLEKQKDPENVSASSMAPSCWQKEQKIMEPSYDELQRHQDELYDFKVFATKQAREHHISFVHDFEWNNFCAELLSYFAEQKPVEWSEGDKDKLYQIIETLLADKEVARRENPQHYDALSAAYDELISWLKSLRPQPHWKPSEEQMEALLEAEKYLYAGLQYDHAKRIAELYKHFKEQK